jgi:oligosaccharyltransferase complex subunit gamma
MATVAVLFVLLLIRFAIKNFSGISSLKLPWQLLVLSFTVIMSSGYMWNTIRTPPFIALGPNGKPSYFAQGFQTQFGFETTAAASLCIIFFLY